MIDNTANIKDTIAKLLALAGSPNEHEAKAALLKARELMVKYKLREIDIKRLETAEVVERLTGITCTKMTNTWAARLSAIVADHYCCKAFRQHCSGEKKITVGLVGFADDIDICERVLTYAVDCAVSQCKQIRSQHKGAYPAKIIRQMENAYGNGFCEGVKNAYLEQDAEHQEYGLVLITPQPVIDAITKMGESSAYGDVNYSAYRMQFAQQGYRDGFQFDPSDKLPAKL